MTVSSLLIILFVIFLVAITIIASKSPKNDPHKPKFRGYLNIGGNITEDWRSDAEVYEDANRRF